MDATNKELHTIIQSYGLTRQQVADMAMCRNKSTVDRWLVPARRGNKPNSTYRRMPEIRLKTLKEEIRIRKIRPKKSVDTG